MVVLPLGFIAYVVLFGTGPDGTCTINRPPCSDLDQLGDWAPMGMMVLVILGFAAFFRRSVTGGKERRRALASGTSSVVARLLAIESTGTSVNDAPKFNLEFELPDGGVVCDGVLVAPHLLAQLIPGAHVPILLTDSGEYFQLDTDAMSRVQPV